MKKILFLMLFTILSFSLFSNESLLILDEKINNYDVNIQLNKNGTIDVTEVIDYHTSRNDKHGIYRDIPTTDLESFLGKNKILITKIKIYRNGDKERFTAYTFEDGIRYKIGNEKSYIPNNNRYIIKYRVHNALKNQNDIYQIYWNAIGQFWRFPIDSYKVSVTYEKGMVVDKKEIQKLEISTGKYGSVGSNYNIGNTDKSGLVITSKEKFNAYEGMTLLLNLKTDKINPTFLDKMYNYYLIYKNLIVGFVIILISIIYSIITWKRFGKDLLNSTIVPEFKPHKKYSAMMVAYVNKERKPEKLINIGMLSLISKKFIEILDSEERKYKYRLVKDDNKDTSKLLPDEVYLYNLLLVNNLEDDIDNTSFYNVANKLVSYLKWNYNKEFYESNSRLLGILRWLILMFVVFSVFILLLDVSSNLGFHILEFIFVIFVLSIVYRIYKKNIGRFTALGVDILSYIGGLKMYINTAEKNKIIAFTDLKDLVSFFREILPFAVALDIKNQCIEIMENQIRLNKHNSEENVNIILENDINKMYFSNLIYNDLNRLYNIGKKESKRQAMQ